MPVGPMAGSRAWRAYHYQGPPAAGCNVHSALRKATDLLDEMRSAPMRRGAISHHLAQLKDRIADAIAARQVSPTLAHRVAFQLVFKFHENDLEGPPVWSAIGDLLFVEIAQLKERFGLADRQIAEALPKMSASQIDSFLHEVSATDRRIARTILNAAIHAADPLSAGKRYLEEYCQVARQLETIDPRVARTLANATFTAGTPANKAMELLKRLTDLMGKFEGEGSATRMVARATFRAVDPAQAAAEFVEARQAIAAELIASGIDAAAARSLAGLRALRTPVTRKHARLSGNA